MKKLLRLFKKGVRPIATKPVSVETSQIKVPIDNRTPWEIAEETGIPVIIERHYDPKAPLVAYHKNDPGFTKEDIDDGKDVIPIFERNSRL